MNEVSQIQARIAELEARRDYAAMTNNCWLEDALNEDIRKMTYELYDQDVAHKVPRST